MNGKTTLSIKAWENGVQQAWSQSESTRQRVSGAER